MDAVMWCKRMQEEATDGNDSYNYYLLMELWQSRLESNKPAT